MLNQIVLVGRLTSDPEVKEVKDGEKVAYIKVACPRPFKNADGEYETDFVPCTLWNSIATNTAGYCKKGDIIGVKGRVQSNEDKIEIVAEKLTFLSSKRDDEDED